MNQNKIYDRLCEFIDDEPGKQSSWDEVNYPMIRHWCEAMGDENPIYWDSKLTTGVDRDDVVAPPTMLMAWTMKGYAGKLAPGSTDHDPFAKAMVFMDEQGFNGVVATNSEQSYERYIKPGEKLYHLSSVDAVSTYKTTGLGSGYFITQKSEFFNEDDEKVGDMLFRVFRFIPAN